MNLCFCNFCLNDKKCRLLQYLKLIESLLTLYKKIFGISKMSKIIKYKLKWMNMLRLEQLNMQSNILII